MSCLLLFLHVIHVIHVKKGNLVLTPINLVVQSTVSWRCSEKPRQTRSITKQEKRRCVTGYRSEPTSAHAEALMRWNGCHRNNFVWVGLKRKAENGWSQPEGVNTEVAFRALAKKERKKERKNEREKSLEVFFCCIATRGEVQCS